jgi:hypothetical protein
MMPLRMLTPALFAVLLLAMMPGQANDSIESLRQTLLSLGERDQAAINTDEPSEVALRGHVAELKHIVSVHGWPRSSAVGPEAARAAWLVAQHADFDPAFQKEALRHMESLASDGEAEAKLVGYLTDRVAVNEGRPQVYGTQGGCQAGRWQPSPIADPERVEMRRASVSMEPLSFYKELGSSMYCSRVTAE